MPNKKPRSREQLVSHIERWQVGLAEDLGIIEEIRLGQLASGQRPVIRSSHSRPYTRYPKSKKNN